MSTTSGSPDPTNPIHPGMVRSTAHIDEDKELNDEALSEVDGGDDQSYQVITWDPRGEFG